MSRVILISPKTAIAYDPVTIYSIPKPSTRSTKSLRVSIIDTPLFILDHQHICEGFFIQDRDPKALGLGQFRAGVASGDDEVRLFADGGRDAAAAFLDEACGLVAGVIFQLSG